MTSNMFAENKLNEYCHHQLRFSACSERDMMLVDYHLKYAELKNRLNEHFKPGEHVLHVKSSACLWCQLRLELVLFVLQGKRSNLYGYCVPRYHRRTEGNDGVTLYSMDAQPAGRIWPPQSEFYPALEAG